jgi:hypothetical protein
MRWRPTREARMMAAILAMGFAGALAPGLRSTVAAQAPPGSIGTTTATMPDGACSMNDRRFVDCGNGTVTDQVTGLIWLKDAACLGFQDYDGANRARRLVARRAVRVERQLVAGAMARALARRLVAHDHRAVRRFTDQPSVDGQLGNAVLLDGSRRHRPV